MLEPAGYNPVMNDDAQHLKLLSIFHYVVAGIAVLMGCFPMIHLALGVALLTGQLPTKPGEAVSDAFVGWVFTGMASVMIVTMWSFAIVLAFAGRFLRERRRHTYCLIVAGLECMFMPFGTVLGVFTIIVLLCPSVRQLFDADGSSMAASGG